MAAKIYKTLFLGTALTLGGCAILTLGGCSYTPVPQERAPAHPSGPVTHPAPQPEVYVPPSTREQDHRAANSANYLPTPAPTPQPQQTIATAVPAARSLLDKAKLARRQGLLAEADALLERAMRLAPSEPALYLETAEVRLAQGNFVAAMQFAQKTLSLLGSRDAISSRDQRAQAWRVIADARAGQGDQGGAAQARREMERWN